MSLFLSVFVVFIVTLLAGYLLGINARKSERESTARSFPDATPGHIHGELTILNATVGKEGIERIDAEVKLKDSKVVKVTLAGAMADFLVTYLSPLASSPTFSTYAALKIGEAGEVLDLQVSF